MKRLFVLLLTVVLGLSTLAFTACGGSRTGPSEGVLDITFYNGGFGEDWLKNACEAYKQIKPDFKYNLVPETSNDCGAATLLKSGKNLPDLFMANNLGFPEFVTGGLIEPLDTVYNAKVTTSSGEKTVYDYLIDGIKDRYWMQKRAGQTENLPWAMPWSILPGAMVYNQDILLSTTHVDNGFAVSADKISNGKWIAPPATIDELLAYFADIESVNAVKSDAEKITAFGWPGTAPNYFFFVLYQWWAEAQGVDTSNYSGEGSWYDFWNFGNTETDLTKQQKLSLSVFNQSGQKKAVDTLRSLIIDSNGNYKNSPKNVNSLTIQQLEQAFVQGKVAIALGSSFLECEMSAFINENTPTFKLMNVPSLNGYSGTQYCQANVGEIMYIPSAATDKQIAKDFLVFLCNESNLLAFSKSTGSIRPFEYNPFTLDPNYSWTEFNKSVFEVYESSEMLIDYPKNVSDKNCISYVYRYTNQNMFGAMQMADMLKNMKTLNGTQIMEKVIVESKDAFDGYKTTYSMILVD